MMIIVIAVRYCIGKSHSDLEAHLPYFLHLSLIGKSGDMGVGVTRLAPRALCEQALLSVHTAQKSTDLLRE